MFTLKLQERLHSSQTPADVPATTWIADVQSVSRIKAGTLAVLQPLTISPCPGQEALYPAAKWVSSQTQPDELVALLHVVRLAGSEFVGGYHLVEYAWLLASNGDTVERIAP